MKTKNNYSGLLIMLGVAFFMLLAVLFMTMPTMKVSIDPVVALAGCSGDDCQLYHKHFSNGTCKEKLFPPSAKPKGWDEGGCHDDDPEPTETEEPPEPTETDRPPRPTATDRPPDPTSTDRPPKPTATERPTETEPPDSTDEPRIVMTPTPTATLSVFPAYDQKCNICLLIERCVLALERIAFAQERQVDIQSAIATAISK